MTAPKLLLTARDAGALGHMTAVLHEARRRPSLEVVAYADDPSYAALSSEFPAVRRFLTGASAGHDPDHAARLLGEARAIMRRERPDAVLVGVSHCHEAGVDEAFLAAAEGQPTFAMQDFWGDANLNLGRGAQLYFALDEVAVRLTEARHAKAALACGSPKHSRYAQLDVAQLRRAARARLGLSGERLYVGYFGQALFKLPGYEATVRAFGSALARRRDTVLFFKPHPREGAADVERTVRCFHECGVGVHVVPQGTTEEWLAASDLAVCCFSSCAYDAAFLNRESPVPVLSILYLLFEESVSTYFQRVAGLPAPPPTELGLVGCVTRREDLDAVLDDALTAAARERMWRLAHQHLPDPAHAAGRILEEIGRRLAPAPSARWAGAISEARD